MSPTTTITVSDWEAARAQICASYWPQIQAVASSEAPRFTQFKKLETETCWLTKTAIMNLPLPTQWISDVASSISEFMWIEDSIPTVPVFVTGSQVSDPQSSQPDDPMGSSSRTAIPPTNIITTSSNSGTVNTNTSNNTSSVFTPTAGLGSSLNITAVSASATVTAHTGSCSLDGNSYPSSMPSKVITNGESEVYSKSLTQMVSVSAGSTIQHAALPPVTPVVTSLQTRPEAEHDVKHLGAIIGGVLGSFIALIAMLFVIGRFRKPFLSYLTEAFRKRGVAPSSEFMRHIRTASLPLKGYTGNDIPQNPFRSSGYAMEEKLYMTPQTDNYPPSFTSGSYQDSIAEKLPSNVAQGEEVGRDAVSGKMDVMQAEPNPFFTYIDHDLDPEALSIHSSATRLDDGSLSVASSSTCIEWETAHHYN